MSHEARVAVDAISLATRSLDAAESAWQGPAWYDLSWDQPWREVIGDGPIWAHDLRGLFEAIDSLRSSLVSDVPPHARRLDEVHVVGWGEGKQDWRESIYASPEDAREAYVARSMSMLRRRTQRQARHPKRQPLPSVIIITHYIWYSSESLYLPTGGESRVWAADRSVRDFAIQSFDDVSRTVE